MNRTADADGPARPAAEVQARPNPMPRTQYPEIFGMLAREFRPEHIKVRTHSGRQMPYITARTVMNRLDFALGPENWWDEYEAGEHSVKCRLTIRLPDGQVLTKCDAGGMAGMQDPGDDDKSGYSDAFKRAAVKFGVGRHLYNDGVVSYPKPEPSPRRQPADAPTSRPEPAVSSDCGRWMQTRVDEFNALWAGICGAAKKDYKRLCNRFHCANGIVTAWLESEPPLLYPDAVETDGRRDNAKVAAVLNEMWGCEERETVKFAVDKFLARKLDEAAKAIGINLDAEPTEEESTP